MGLRTSTTTRLATLGLLLTFADVASGTEVVFRSPNNVSESEIVNVAVAGDMMAPIRVKETAFSIGFAEESYFGSIIKEIKPIIQSADIAFANLETPVSQSQPIKPRPFVFNAPSDILRGLKWAGFDVLSVANNHSLDQKSVGLSETLESIADNGLLAVGAGPDRLSALKGTVVTAKDVKVGFLAFTTFINGGNEPARSLKKPYINLSERTKDLFAAIDYMKSRADVIILSIHWGVEYETKPRQWQRDLAKTLHDRGVDVIVGHHPHVLQPIDYYFAKNGRRTLTLYSLGNLVSNQSSYYKHSKSPSKEGNTRDSVVIELQLSKKGIVTFGYHPLWIDNWYGPEEGIRTVAIKSEIGRLEREIKNKRPSPERSFLVSRKQMLMDRKEQIFRTLFPHLSKTSIDLVGQ